MQCSLGFRHYIQARKKATRGVVLPPNSNPEPTKSTLSSPRPVLADFIIPLALGVSITPISTIMAWIIVPGILAYRRIMWSLLSDLVHLLGHVSFELRKMGWWNIPAVPA